LLIAKKVVEIKRPENAFKPIDNIEVQKMIFE